MKVDELRQMSDEQLDLTRKESSEALFRLRIQSQTDRLDAPSELHRHRKTIARVKTLQTERLIAEKATSGSDARVAVEKAAQE